MDAIEDNQTWTLCALPQGHRAIGLKWVFKLKKNDLGEVVSQAQGKVGSEMVCATKGN
jgi:hypothetical protein